jgi:tRNA threonylcarbamoyladenosine biosynthesis protein TsaE
MRNSSISQIKILALKLSLILKKGDFLLLYGNIGTGKTTLARYIINNIQKKNKKRQTEIPSPTFNIAFEYNIKNFIIRHFDLYRIKKKLEINNIGLFEEMDNAITIVEWPELIKKKPKNYIKISFKYSKKINERNLRISSHGRCKEYEIN